MIGLAGYIDVETTGFSPVNDEIIEFAICLFKFRRDSGEIIEIVENYVGLREPKKKIPWYATKVHGIKNTDVQGMELDYSRIEAMIHKAEFLIAHNASFDQGFTEVLFPNCADKTWLCSMNGINWRQKGFRSKGLQKLLTAHGIGVMRAHRAEDDVMAAMELLSLTCKCGKRYFLELLKQLPEQDYWGKTGSL